MEAAAEKEQKLILKVSLQMRKISLILINLYFKKIMLSSG